MPVIKKHKIITRPSRYDEEVLGLQDEVRHLQSELDKVFSDFMWLGEEHAKLIKEWNELCFEHAEVIQENSQLKKELESLSLLAKLKADLH